VILGRLLQFGKRVHKPVDTVDKGQETFWRVHEIVSK